MDWRFWQERWEEGRTGFHLDRAHAALERHWPTLEASSRPERVLVPLCGKARDLIWLRARGLRVCGVEFVRKAIVDFAAESGLDLAIQRRGRHEVFQRDGLELWVSDFFELSSNELGRFDAAFDRAALVAVEPGRRGQYAGQLGRLVAPGGSVLLVSLWHDLPGGPPHSVDESEVLELFSEEFRVELLEESDVLGAEPHFRERGATRFVEQIYRLARR